MNQKVITKLHFDQLLLLLQKMILQKSISEKKDFYYLLEKISIKLTILQDFFGPRLAIKIYGWTPSVVLTKKAHYLGFSIKPASRIST